MISPMRLALCASVVLAAGSLSGTQSQTARVSGRLTASDGRALLSGAVTMAAIDGQADAVPPDQVSIFPDGQFSFGQVSPGSYQIRARGETQANGRALFATFRLDVAGRDVSNIEMTLRPGAVLTGQVLVVPHVQRSSILTTTLTVRAPLVDGSNFGDALTGRVGRDGAFVIRGVSVGTHHVVMTGIPDAWTIDTVMLSGRDITDLPFDVANDQPLRDMRITITDGSTDVTGVVLDARKEPARDAGVVVFSVSPQFWIPGGRRLRSLRTGSDGRFAVHGLPAGGYLAVAIPAAKETRELKPQELERLRGSATEFKLTPDRPEATIELTLARESALPAR
jgi:hypothetical protein